MKTWREFRASVYQLRYITQLLVRRLVSLGRIISRVSSDSGRGCESRSLKKLWGLNHTLRWLVKQMHKTKNTVRRTPMSFWNRGHLRKVLRRGVTLAENTFWQQLARGLTGTSITALLDSELGETAVTQLTNIETAAKAIKLDKKRSVVTELHSGQRPLRWWQRDLAEKLLEGPNDRTIIWIRCELKER